VQRRGRYGLVFLDGHTDDYTPRTSGTGGIAGMDLYFACRSLVEPRHVVHLGRRDFEEARAYRGELPPEILDLHLDVVRSEGPQQAAERAMAHLAELDGFFIHVDVDVLDDAFMPCVDSRQPGGLTPEELRESIEVLRPRAVAAEVTIFDPVKDADGEAARGLVSVLTAFAS
jgi:arginase